MKKISVALVIGFFAHGSLFADPGKTGLGFLSLGNGARSIGMGEAQSALAEASNAIYWNPAGLGLTPFPELTLTHAELFEDSAQQYAALALPLRKGARGTLGFSVTRFSITDIEARDAQAALQNEKLEQEDLNLQVSYGFRVGPLRQGYGGQGGLAPRSSPQASVGGLYLGVGVKRISEKLAHVSASAFGFDVGAQYRPGEGPARALGEWARRMSLAVSALNMGKGPTFDKEETPLPQTTRFGLAYTHFLWGDALTLASDYEIAKSGENRMMGGAEFWVKNMLALRAGYVQGQDIGDEVRFGAGFRFQTLQIDYALARFGEALGDTHRFTLTFRFGEGAVKATTGLKPDLVGFYLSQAQDDLAAGSYHEAVINANNVLEVDPHNPQALQILFEAGERMKTPSPLPEPMPLEKVAPQEETKDHP
ncbi:MAG: hypothetical protein KCHDKBKB_02143 [Elusimicrobia bacterium]|nr:hypothetical protein [Elusimicrobiota bacterium]